MFKKFRVKAASLLALGSIIASSGAATTAFAASNHSDTYWKNEYRTWSTNDHTPARRKYNLTAMYNYTQKGNTSATIWAALYDGRDVSRGYKYNTYAGKITYLTNWALETVNGNKNPKKDSVAVRIDSSSWSNGWLSGVWSPDSI